MFAAYEDEIRFDDHTGAVGTGKMTETIFRPGQVRVRFELALHPQVTRYELHRVHDEIIPLIQVQLNKMNLAAKAKYGQSLLSSIIHRYPGEYEASPAQTLTPDELAYVIDALKPIMRAAGSAPNEDADGPEGP